jgi:hypothetical protein
MDFHDLCDDLRNVENRIVPDCRNWKYHYLDQTVENEILQVRQNDEFGFMM